MMRAVAPTSHRDTAAKFGGDRLDIAERPVAAAVIELVQCTGLHRKHVIGRGRLGWRRGGHHRDAGHRHDERPQAP